MKEKCQKLLYHYTDILGLEGILGAQCLWATSIRYLNDSQEFKYGFGVLEKLVNERRKNFPVRNELYWSDLLQGKINPSTCEEVKAILYFSMLQLWPDLFEEFQICVFSLSAEKDLLSQWRGYCPPAGGYSIGFRFDLLNSFLIGRSYCLKQCLYHAKGQEDLVNRVIGKITEKFIERWRQGLKLNLHAILPDFLVDFTRVAARLKDKSFKEEKEWRIISNPIPVRDLEYRPGKAILIPFFKIHFEEAKSFPISEIIIGPGPDQELAKKSLQMFTRKNNLNIQINLSKIPYREL